MQQLEVVAGSTLDDAWLRLADVDGHLDHLVDVVVGGAAGGRRDVAGSYLAGWLTHLVAGHALVALRDQGRSWSSGCVAVHPHPDGWFDGLAVPADRPITDGTALVDDLVASLEPAYRSLRRRVPFGVAGMWGTLADSLATDDALVDALAARVGLRARPRTQLVDDRTVTVRSTCCLWFKVFDGEPDPDGEGYCTTCPHRTDASRAAIVRAGAPS